MTGDVRIAIRVMARYLCLALFALLLFGQGAWAWGDTAHQVICEIAFRLAKPATQAEITRLIVSDPAGAYPDFSESCVYPDHPFPKKHRIRDSEHYINLPRESNGLQSDECPTADLCVVSAISKDAKVLSSKNESDASRLVALKSLGHWVGDIHQPLHVSFANDVGGNRIKVSGCPPAKTLHAVWDTCLVNDVVRHGVPKAVAELMETITPAKRAQWAASGSKDWANETFAIAKAPSTWYCVMHDQSCDRSTDGQLMITVMYIETNKPVVREQMQKAGVRLARILDEAMGN